MAIESHIITREKDTMIDMLLSGNTIKSIADTCHVSRQTIYAWKAEPLIKAEIERRREALKKTAQDKLVHNVGTCIDNMYALANQDTDKRTKYQANKFIIEMALGKATTTVQDNNTNDKDNKNTNVNELKSELDDIKNIRAVK